MPKKKQFDETEVLLKAKELFSEKGYNGTSMDDLVQATGLSRSSIYDTFGDKRSLYLEALKRYNTDSVSRIVDDMKGNGSALDALEAALVAFASRPTAEASLGCMGVSAVCEFGRTDNDVATLTDSASATLGRAVTRLIEDGLASGEISAEIDPDAAVQFLGATLSGMKVSARNGATPDILRTIARLAIRSLR